MRFGLPIRILAAAVVLALALVGLVVREGMARAEGQEVMLAITGYDPRSLLTGHYVQFQFEERLPPGTRCPPGVQRIIPQPRAWIALKRDGDHHVAVAASPDRAKVSKLGEAIALGAVTCRESSGGVAERDHAAEPTVVTLDLGVDRLHVDQAEAEAIQKHLRERRDAPAQDYAVISVGRDGRARLKGLVVAGKRSDLDWF
jgi:hypothetical protein